MAAKEFSNSATTAGWFADPPSRGSWNMALDEALAQACIDGGAPVVRFYQWQEPTLSLGYFQRYEDRFDHVDSAQCAVVRRTTGGGAILHDQELTYSCIVPRSHPLSRRAGDLYRAVHTSIIDVLAEFGLKAQFFSGNEGIAISALASTAHMLGCGTAAEKDNRASSARSTEVPFLCFQRRTAGDVLLGEWKIAGSAQRRLRRAVLQHGSILLSRSPFAPELPGICDLASIALDAAEFARRLRAALSSRLGWECSFQPPGANIQQLASEIEAAKFATDGWLRAR
jgi:lipoate-protein ligase A